MVHPSLEQAKNLQGLELLQFRPAMLLASWLLLKPPLGHTPTGMLIAARNSVSLDSVPPIIQGGTEIEMIRSHAGRIVTVMEHSQAIRDRAEMDNPRGSVSAEDTAAVRLSDTAPVPILVEAASPKPTAVRLLDITPKTNGERDMATGINTLGHRTPQRSVAPAPICLKQIGASYVYCTRRRHADAA